jgi:hypothetical protein
MNKIIAVSCLFLMSFIILGCRKGQEDKTVPSDSEFPWYGQVNASSLFVRSEPARNAAILEKINSGHRIDVTGKCEVTETIDGKISCWYKVKTMSGKTGYSFGAYIAKAVSRDSCAENSSTVMRCPDSIRNSYECAQYLEKSRITMVRDKIIRDGGRLTVNCSENRPLVFTDSESHDDSAGSWYSFINYYKELGQFLIMVQYYEGSTCYLVNEATGGKIEIWNEPLFSPDRKFFIVSSLGGMAHYVPNGIQVWEKRNKEYVKVLERETGWEAVNLQWRDNVTVRMTRCDFNEGRYYSFMAEAVFSEGRWTLNE